MKILWGMWSAQNDAPFAKKYVEDRVIKLENFFIFEELIHLNIYNVVSSTDK